MKQEVSPFIYKVVINDKTYGTVEVMQCPYCDRDDILTEDALDRHIVKEHLENTEIADARFSRKLGTWTIALGLTNSTFGTQGGKSKEEVLETFKFFLRELMKSEG